jgi:hypothetical protein
MRTQEATAGVGRRKIGFQMRKSLPLEAHSYNCFSFPDLPERGTMKRGQILRDTRTGRGLLIIEGRQHWFGMEGVWKSEVPPTPGLAVDVELDHSGQILAITAVSEFQVAQKHAERSLNSVKRRG